jgi:hypothetical protein
MESTMRTILVPLVLTLAACPSSPSSDDDDAAPNERELLLDCEPQRFEARAADGRVNTQVWWFARVPQPFMWSAVFWRQCSPMVQGVADGSECPVGSTCSGVAPIFYPFCRSGIGVEQPEGGTGDGRIPCGHTVETTNLSGMTSVSGHHYQLVQVRLVD